ncbi:MAG: transcriptional regulator [Flavobacteriales bacterium]|nr:transcriptional regulator [Flavobacteriales bacterium]|tara:strand:+ start:4206 stop:4577 length:372 start_codon:yes stop_codon:yes gene_type:complete
MKEKVGQRIKTLRERRGHSQEEVADSIHVSRATYERMENGKSNSWASHLEQLSSFFEVSPEYFVQDEEKSVQNNENPSGGMQLQNNGTIKTLNTLSEIIIEQYELRLQEKDKIISLLEEKLKE